jgi:hypothetical protein
MSAEDFEGNGVKIGAEKSAGFVAGSGAEQREESFLGKFLRMGGIRDTAAKKAEERLFVAGEKLRECSAEPCEKASIKCSSLGGPAAASCSGVDGESFMAVPEGASELRTNADAASCMATCLNLSLLVMR